MMIRQRKPLKRKKWLSRSPLVSSARISRKEPVRKRRARVRTRNTKRHKTNWQRSHHSSARVQWVKRQPCAISGATGYPLRVNAHTVTGGTSRKANYETIIPLDARLHAKQHNKGWSAILPLDFVDEKLRKWERARILAALAAETQARWIAHADREGLPR